VAAAVGDAAAGGVTGVFLRRLAGCAAAPSAGFSADMWFLPTRAVW
jgi:hypothetical protein